MGGLTERQKDERDLQVLKDYDDGASVDILAHRYRTTQCYVKRLLKEALGDG